MDVTARDLKVELDGGKALCLIDVREPCEWALGHLPSARHMPLAQLRERVRDLDTKAAIVCYCKAGGRSARACEFLREAGFSDVRTLAGGILAWAEQVDPSLPTC